MPDDDEELQRIRARKLEALMRKQNEPPIRIVPTAPVNITDTQFRSFLAENPVAVVDCWAPWCGPCKMIAPVLDEMAHKYAGDLVIGKLNTDENPLVASAFGVQSIPTLLFFRNGNLVDRVVGVSPKQHLEAKIRIIIGK